MPAGAEINGASEALAVPAGAEIDGASEDSAVLAEIDGVSKASVVPVGAMIEGRQSKQEELPPFGPSPPTDTHLTLPTNCSVLPQVLVATM